MLEMIHYIELIVSILTLFAVSVFIKFGITKKQAFYAVINEKRKGLIIILGNFIIYILLEILEIVELFMTETLEYSLQLIIFLVWLSVFSYYSYEIKVR